MRLARWRPSRLAATMALVVGAGVAFAQDEDIGELGPPMWEADPEHPDDVFTFVRAKYSSAHRGRWGWGRRWSTDYPDSDIHFSMRLQQLTSLKVNPVPKVLELSDPALLGYPFLYLIEPGAMSLDDTEVAGLRRYLLAGGFMMVDDFWGEREWRNFYEEMKRVLPEREPVELDVSHPIFSAVFPLTQKPQVPSIHTWQGSGLTYERHDAQEPHYQAWFDDDGRMMAIACHNTDLGDGWEREGEDVEYFRKFAEPQSYPMGINIIFYAMTH
ncbi:MAG TPA: DUF4159 domain-containing protein [Polyangia bacterium]